MILSKRSKLLVCCSAIFLTVCSFCMSFMAIASADSTREIVDNPEQNVPTYLLHIDNSHIDGTGSLPDATYFVNNLAPDENATKIIIEFSVDSHSGSVRQCGLVGYCDNFTTYDDACQIAGGNAFNFFGSDYDSVKLEFCITNRTAVPTHKYNGVYTGIIAQEAIAGTFDVRHFGFKGYRQSGSTWQGTYHIKCYDNTGKDLGILTNSGYVELSSVPTDPQPLMPMTDEEIIEARNKKIKTFLGVSLGIAGAAVIVFGIVMVCKKKKIGR